MTSTIFALSSGRPPAAIAVMRVSGPAARAACIALAGTLPPPRRASLRTLRDADGAILDRALIVLFPGPATATGEDLLELHLHGGRAVVAAVERALAEVPGLVPALPGEFTRRALANGRIDLAQAEGLADLLEAETEMQRRAAQAASEGAVSREVAGWLDRISMIAARVEAELDFGDEDDVEGAAPFDIAAAASALCHDIDVVLARPPVERLRDGVLVVIAGPPNAGKSSLFNAMLGRDAAIVTPVAGTTRDVLEASVTRAGLPFRLVDTAGLTAQTDDPIERIGIDRARILVDQADIVLWLGTPGDAPDGAIRVASKSDLSPPPSASTVDLTVSAYDAGAIECLWEHLSTQASQLLTSTSAVHLHETQRSLVRAAREDLVHVGTTNDVLVDAEHLRVASRCLAAILGRDATEAMLDVLFGRFCLGK